jgi:hypothetical protein
MNTSSVFTVHRLAFFRCHYYLFAMMIHPVGLMASILLLNCIAVIDAFSMGSTTFASSSSKASSTSLTATRRSLLESASKSLAVGATSLVFGGSNVYGREVTDVTSGGIPDLPSDAQRSYLQYRFPLQLAADFYIFDLQTMVGDTGEFVAICELLNAKSFCRCIRQYRILYFVSTIT